MTTARQEEANRRNAQASTGPRTEAGKRASARNALRHGAYASSTAIGTWPWFEDAAELDRQMDEVVDALAPCTEAEVRVAHLIAETLLRSDRVAQYEAAMLAATSGAGDMPSACNYLPGNHRLARQGRALAVLLEKGADHTPTDDEADEVSLAFLWVFERFVMGDYDDDDDGDTKDSDPWSKFGYAGFDHRRTAVDLETALAMIWSVMRQTYGSDRDAIAAAEIDAARFEGLFHATLMDARHETGRRCLDAIRTVSLDASDRISRQLQRNLATYERLRRLSGDPRDTNTRNEPSSREQ